ncbi:hypothetical protein BFS86_19820 [Shewanella algae]|jgi:hypothetical protein|nr:hypothetical protein BFS86_19820 [Shewanella algae]DAQ47172.1 MAG TPA: hypothetical protein [Caudoviricetes sp.]
MKRLSKRQVVNDYLAKADGDVNKALVKAVDDMLTFAKSTSGGFVRCAPAALIRPINLHDDPIDIDPPDGDEE